MNKNDNRMRLYRTSDDSIINLDEISAITPFEDDYKIVLFSNGLEYKFKLSEKDIDNIMEYNNYFIK